MSEHERRANYYHGYQAAGTTMRVKARRWAKRRLAKLVRRETRRSLVTD